jgi:aquaporin Z
MHIAVGPIKGEHMPLSKKLAAEFIGTFWLVLGGCGSAVLAAGFPGMGIGFVGVSIAFGLTVLTMAYAIGHISGCHLNPAVSIGLWAGKRFPASELVPYILAQVVGALVGGGVLLLIASGKPGWFDAPRMLAANGYGAHSPGGYSMFSGFVAEVVMTMMFLLIILGATDGRAPKGFAPIAIGSRDRRRLGPRAALALLGGAHHRRARRRRSLLLAGRPRRRGHGRQLADSVSGPARLRA